MKTSLTYLIKSNIFRLMTLSGLIAFFVLATPQESEAQIWKNLGRKVEQKVEQQASRRLERRIDKAIDKGFDEAEKAADDAIKGDGKQSTSGEATTTSGSNSSIDMSTLLGGGNVAVRDQYRFNLGIDYQMQTSDKKSDQLDMSMWFSPEGYVGMASVAGNETTFSVIDTESMVIFMESQKTYMAMGNQMLGQIGDAAIEQAGKSDPGNVQMTRLADEKILGYTCRVYRMVSDDGEAKVWVTTELDANPFSALEGLRNMSNQIQLSGELRDLNGAMLKMESKDTKNKQTVVMQATKVHKQAKTIRASDYKKMGS